jgi:hypothetical protein
MWVLKPIGIWTLDHGMNGFLGDHMPPHLGWVVGVAGRTTPLPSVFLMKKNITPSCIEGEERRVFALGFGCVVQNNTFRTCGHDAANPKKRSQEMSDSHGF